SGLAKPQLSHSLHNSRPPPRPHPDPGTSAPAASGRSHSGLPAPDLTPTIHFPCDKIPCACTAGCVFSCQYSLYTDTMPVAGSIAAHNTPTRFQRISIANTRGQCGGMSRGSTTISDSAIG